MCYIAAPRASLRKVTPSPGETALQHNDAEVVAQRYYPTGMVH